MIDTIIQVVMSMLLLIGGIIVGMSLLQAHRAEGPPKLTDLLTSTDPRGVTRFDARKCWEAGTFAVSTWAFVFLTASGKLTEFFFVGYMTTWVGARFLRDREKRMPVGENLRVPEKAIT